MAYLDLKNLLFRQSSWELKIDAEFEKESCTAIIGRSGAGKSTLLSLIAGFEIPNSGSIVVGGVDVTQHDPATRPVTILFQEHNLFSHLTIWRNIALGVHPKLKISRKDKKLIDHAISTVGLEGLENRFPGQVSGGERQRVALARCICQKRPVLLLDEPFNSLDPALRKEMTGLVDKLRIEHCLTILLVSHNPHEASEIAQNALFLENGKVLENGRFDDLLQTPKSDELKKYLIRPGKQIPLKR